MARRRYLVSYDISDDRRRTKTFKILQAWGDHAQYSVFFVEANAAEYVGLRGRLDREIHHDDDQILLLDLGPAHQRLVDHLECLGRVYSPPSRARVV